MDVTLLEVNEPSQSKESTVTAQLDWTWVKLSRQALQLGLGRVRSFVVSTYSCTVTMHTSRGSSHSLMSEGSLEWNVFHKKPVELIYSSRILFIYLFSSSFVLKWGMASAIIPLTESDWLEELLFVIWRVSHEQVASCAAITSPLNVPLVLEATLRSLNQLHFCCKYRRLLPNFPAFFATNTGTKHVLAEGYAMDDLPIFWPWVESDEWRGGPSHFVRPCNFWVVEGWKKMKDSSMIQCVQWECYVSFGLRGPTSTYLDKNRTDWVKSQNLLLQRGKKKKNLEKTKWNSKNKHMLLKAKEIDLK